MRQRTFIIAVCIATLTTVSAPGRAVTIPCQAPVNWRVGEVDARFGLDVSNLRRIAQTAAQRWNQTAGRRVLVHDPNARFTINLRYGLRQEAARAIKDVQSDAARREGMLDKMKRTAGQLVRRHNHATARFDQRAKAFSRAADEFKNRLEQHNRRPSNASRDRLLKEQDALKARQAALQREQQRLDNSRAEIEQLREAINARVRRHNDTVNAANDTLQALPNEARQIGVTHLNGMRSKIDLYQYFDDVTLHGTLLHEFGHALGLQHLDDVRAIMYYSRNQRTANDLTAADARALRALCG